MAIPLLCAVLSGLLFAFGLRPWSVEPLGWVALAPLLFASARLPRPLWAMGLGLVSAVVAGMVQVGFRGGGASLNYAYAPYLFIALVFMASATASCWAGRRWPEGSLSGVLFIACAGVVAEFLTLLTPLPVGIALCQYRNTALIQIAAVTGIWGISFLLYLVNAAIADAVRRKSVPVLPLLAACGLTAVVWLGGWVALQLPRGGEAVTVAAVQDYTGLEATERDPGAPGAPGNPPIPDDLPDAEALMRQAAKGGARLIVGSENAFGTSYHPTNPEDSLNRLARETGGYLVVGHEALATPKDFNCATLISPEGAPVGTHHKMKLFLGERQMMQAGTRASAWETALGRVGLLICFDNCFTASTRQAAQAGARVVALPNYDPPTPRAALHNLHAALTPIRAVENRVAYIRADPNGLSQLVDCRGRIVAEAGMYQPAALVGTVAFGSGSGTFFTRFGDWFPVACLVLAVVLWWRVPARSVPPTPPADIDREKAIASEGDDTPVAPIIGAPSGAPTQPQATEKTEEA